MKTDMKIENLTNEEFEKLSNYKSKMVKKILGICLFSVAVFVVIFSIPKKYLPETFFRNNSPLDANFFQVHGIVTSAIIIIAFTLLMLVMAYFYYKLPKLAKDVKERKKVKLQVTITKMVKPSPFLKQIDVSFNPSYNGRTKILFIEETDLSNFGVGQKVEITATKNALYPFSITPAE